MPIMNWDQSLDIGIEPMNAEHREILQLMNKIYDASGQGQAGGLMNLHVSQLGDVCRRHFADEEKLMAEIRFTGIETHKMLHQKLLTKYFEHAAAIKAAGRRADEGFFNFLKF